MGRRATWDRRNRSGRCTWGRCSPLGRRRLWGRRRGRHRLQRRCSASKPQPMWSPPSRGSSGNRGPSPMALSIVRRTRRARPWPRQAGRLRRSRGPLGSRTRAWRAGRRCWRAGRGGSPRRSRAARVVGDGSSTPAEIGALHSSVLRHPASCPASLAARGAWVGSATSPERDAPILAVHVINQSVRMSRKRCAGRSRHPCFRRACDGCATNHAGAIAFCGGLPLVAPFGATPTPS